MFYLDKTISLIAAMFCHDLQPAAANANMAFSFRAPRTLFFNALTMLNREGKKADLVRRVP